MPDIATPPDRLPPRAVHPEQPLPSQSTVTVGPTGALTLVVTVEQPSCC